MTMPILACIHFLSTLLLGFIKGGSLLINPSVEFLFGLFFCRKKLFLVLVIFFERLLMSLDIEWLRLVLAELKFRIALLIIPQALYHLAPTTLIAG